MHEGMLYKNTYYNKPSPPAGYNAPRPCPGHGERPEIRNAERLRNVITPHGARAFYQNVSTLAGIPRVLEQVVKPSPELEAKT